MHSPSPCILLCWAGRPGYIPPPTLSPNQVTVYSHHDRKNPGLIDPPRQLADRQDYDLEALAEQVGGKQQFDLICVSSGANTNNQPRNLGAFRCPKVLMVGDTHHIIANPIRFVLDYMAEEHYDIVTSMHNRDHNKWFRDIGGVRTGWFPGLTAQNIETPFISNRDPAVAFVGSWRRSHPRRKSFINKIRRDSIPLDHQKMGRVASTPHYANSLISFNCSLNGDMNMRIHEILSSGGLLLTDRLAAASGIDSMLREGQEYVAYDSYRDFRDKARSLLADPARAVAIARRGFDRYQAEMRPDYLAPRFLEWALQGKHSQYDYTDVLDGGMEPDLRLPIYEYALRLQLWNERSRALFCGPRASGIASDLGGLPRVEVVSVVSPSDRLANGTWPMVVADTEIGEIAPITTDKLFCV